MEQKKRVAVFSSRKYDKAYLAKALDELKGNFEFTFLETPLKLETVSLSQGYDAVCVFVNDSLGEDVLRKMNEYGVKLIALRCAGFNNVNMKVANELGIKVVRVPAYSPYAVAEFATCLLLALIRKIKKSIFRTREGNFQLDGLLGFDLYGKTVGIVGTGKIGLCFIKIMLGFGVKILCCDPYPNPEVLSLGLTYTTFEDVIANSDIISLHVNLTKDNFHLIGKEAIDKMKKGVILINVSRGPLMDTQAVIEGLKSGKIGGLGNDVVENEEEVFFHDKSDEVIKDDKISRLMASNNVILTGHQAFFTVEAIENISSTTVSNLSKVLSGEECANIVR